MDSKLFASHYPSMHTLPPEHDGSTFAMAQRWSTLFGGHLHQILQGKKVDALNIDSYTDWVETDYSDLEHELFREQGNQKDIESAARQLNELTFHMLNSSMMPLWLASHIQPEREADKKARKEAIILAQGNLAIRALNLYDYKSKLAKQGTYFNPDYALMKRTIQGRLTEMDVAISVLDYIKRSRLEMNLYAAPAQFEHGSNGESNVDLIAYIPDDNQAVGIQVKSTVFDHHAQWYDRNKVVLIDGTLDLDNQKLVYDTEKNKRKVIPWGGMIAIAHLHEMSRQEIQTYTSGLVVDTKYFHRKRFLAKHYMGDTRSRTAHAANTIGERLDHYFESQKVA